jgi:hypothetical protein
MVDGGRIPESGEITANIRHSRRFSMVHDRAYRNLQDRKGVRGSDKGTPGDR